MGIRRPPPTPSAPENYNKKGEKEKGSEWMEQILKNQNKMIETLTGEIRGLKEQRNDEEQLGVQKQIERLEKLLEKKEQKAEQEEFQYQLKRDMAEYVKGLGEILAGQREEIHGPQDEVDALMGKAEDKLAAMTRMAKKQAKVNKKKLREEESDDQNTEKQSVSKATTSRKSKGKAGFSETDDNLPNPDQMMNLLMQQGQQGNPMGMGFMPGGVPRQQPFGMMMPGGGPMGNMPQMPSQRGMGR